jgi:cytoplasmic iron level regulating protein YaaA (DUF328/UPF0246 family)
MPAKKKAKTKPTEKKSDSNSGKELRIHKEMISAYNKHMNEMEDFFPDKIIHDGIKESSICPFIKEKCIMYRCAFWNPLDVAPTPNKKVFYYNAKCAIISGLYSLKEINWLLCDHFGKEMIDSQEAEK